MIKHVGKHGDRKVAILFREVPGDEHMCLVIYPEVMPVSMHDSIMRVIESPEGQAADTLGDVLFRNLFTDGRPMLQTLHAEGMIKKVQTRQVTVTPTSTSSVNLEEMNNILREMKLGEDAVKRLAELDASRGMTGKVRPRDDFGRELGAPNDSTRSNLAGSNAVQALNDGDIAQNLKSQAERMAAEARQLLAESERLLKESAAMSGTAAEPAPAVATTKLATRRAKKVKAADAAQ